MSPVRRITRRLAGLMWIPLIALVVLGSAACQPEDLGYDVADLPSGSAERGAELYNASIDGAPTCASCHAIEGSAKSGPSLAGYAVVASDRVDDQSAAEYTFYSILQPAKHVTQGYSNVMYDDYADALSQQQIADLIAYLLTL